MGQNIYPRSIKFLRQVKYSEALKISKIMLNHIFFSFQKYNQTLTDNSGLEQAAKMGDQVKYNSLVLFFFSFLKYYKERTRF